MGEWINLLVSDNFALYIILLLGISRHPGLKRIKPKDGDFSIFAKQYEDILEYWDLWQGL